MVIHALTDDMPSFFRPEEPTDEGWYGMYDMLYSLLIRYDELPNLTSSDTLGRTNSFSPPRLPIPPTTTHYYLKPSFLLLEPGCWS